MSTHPHPIAGLEALLRDACRRALGLGLSFTNQIRLYRSILALTREVRLRLGGRMAEAGGAALAPLLAAVCERASELGLDPELPLPDAILVQRLVVRLSRAVRIAEGSASGRTAFRAQHPLHREEPPQHATTEPAQPLLHAQHPLHRETGPQRPLSKVNAMNQRQRDQRQAAA